MHNRIRALRKELKLSQAEFGARLGVSNTAISKIENAENQVTEQMVKAICREFNVNLVWLQTGEGPMFCDTDNTLMATIDRIMYGEDEFAKSVFKAFASLDKSEWQTLEKLITNLSGQKKDQL